jgi:hypothetical protein
MRAWTLLREFLAGQTPAGLSGLFFRTLFWLFLLVWAWVQVLGYLTPVLSQVTYWALKAVVGDWLAQVQQVADVLQVQTRISVSVDGAWRMVTAKVAPARYGYSLPLLWALLLATGGPRRWLWLPLGAVVLLPFQAYSLTMELWRQIVFARPGVAEALGYSQWQLDALAIGYQVGVQLVPTLGPIFLWLWIDSDRLKPHVHGWAEWAGRAMARNQGAAEPQSPKPSGANGP